MAPQFCFKESHDGVRVRVRERGTWCVLRLARTWPLHSDCKTLNTADHHHHHHHHSPYEVVCAEVLLR